MKKDLIKLIEDTERIKTKFHRTGGQGMLVHNIIYDNEDCGQYYKNIDKYYPNSA